MSKLNLPNAITTGRILAAPLVTFLLMQPRPLPRLLAFFLFIAAALSDLWDGHLARKRGQVTSFGKLVDPLADKLLLLATLLPLYTINATQGDLASLPLYGIIPMWAVAVLLGREVLITVLRFAAAGRGRVVAARGIGKRKAVAQNIFIGAAILWVARLTPGFEEPTGGGWTLLWAIHPWFTTAFLSVALLLTIVSAVLYVGTFTRILHDGST